MVINGQRLAALRENKHVRMDVAARALGMRKAAYEEVETQERAEIPGRFIGNICMMLRCKKSDLSIEAQEPNPAVEPEPAKPKAQPRKKAPAKAAAKKTTPRKSKSVK